MSGPLATPVALVVALAVAVLGVVTGSSSAFGTTGGGNEDCPKGTTLLDKYNWNGSAYVAESAGDIVEVSGTVTSGTFTVVKPGYAVSAVVVKGSTDAKVDTYDPPVTSGTFNNSGLSTSSGQTPGISNVKFCGGYTPPPPNTEVTPTITASTPTCANPKMTITPSNQPGVIWNPSGNTVLTPGQSVTYTASPASGYVFPAGTQTSWSFTNTFDVSDCTPVVLNPTGSVIVNCDGTVVFRLNNKASNTSATYELRVGNKGGYKTVAAGVSKKIIMHGKPGDKVRLWGPADVLLDKATVPRPCPVIKPSAQVKTYCVTAHYGEGKVWLDNSDSNRKVRYRVVTNGQSNPYYVRADKIRVLNLTGLKVGSKLKVFSTGKLLAQDVVPSGCAEPLPPGGGLRIIASSPG